MARKTVTKKPKAMPSPEQVFTAMFDRIDEKGYGKTRVSDLTENFGVPLPVFHAVYPSVESVLFKFLDHIDQRMIAEISIKGAAKRDLYFDMLMSLFDTLQEYGPGVKTWLREVIKQPLQLAILVKRWEKTLSLMLDIAKDSPVFPVKKIGLGLVYVYALRAWLKDDSDSMDKTMVAIDQALSKAEDFTIRFLTNNKAGKKA
jgi:ubiquinone biosynthesis protein COQ9